MAGAIFGVAVGAVVPVAAQFQQIASGVYGLLPDVPQAFACVAADGITLRPNIGPYHTPQTLTLNGVTHTRVIVTCP